MPATNHIDLTGFVLGNYLLSERLSDPGDVEVYAGQHAHLARPVAVQVIHATTSQRKAWEGRLVSEARFLSRVVHPSVVHVHDLGMSEDDLIYVVTERVDGPLLAQVLARQELLEPSLALRVTREMARGVAAFHREGLIVAVLDPASAMVVSGPLVGSDGGGVSWIKLVDLGSGYDVGSRRSDADRDLAPSPFLAPEVLGGHPMDERVDVFSLGAVLRELLTCGMTAPELVPGSSVERLVARCTSPDPAARPATMGEFLGMLDSADANWSFGAAIRRKL